MVNTKHDTGSYDCSCYQREIYDGNVLYEAYLSSKKGSGNKPEVQKFEMNFLFELARLQDELKNKTYEFLPQKSFVLKERGKTRFVTGDQMCDRVVKHALCDEVLNPSIRKYLIYDNGVSLKGKGISFTRNRLLTHLHRYYQKYGTNEGYILLMDISKYFDNIRHDKLYELFTKYVDDDLALWLLRKILKQSLIDVSYMSDEEYELCMDNLFNSLEYQKIDKSLLTGEKFMAKHLNIGDQPSQTAGVLYLSVLDNFIKIRKGYEFYARYSDDSYVIHNDKEELLELLEEIKPITEEYGITINKHKTRICKLSDYWRFLQVQYSLTETGRVIQKINPKRVTAIRRRSKKLVGKLSEDKFSNWYKSYFNSHYKLMSKKQRESLNTLFKELKEMK